MPQKFTDCVREGGKVRTITPKPGTYVPICFKGGKSAAGEPKKTKAK